MSQHGANTDNRLLSGANPCRPVVVYSRGPEAAAAALQARYHPGQRVLMAVHFQLKTQWPAACAPPPLVRAKQYTHDLSKQRRQHLFLEQPQWCQVKRVADGENEVTDPHG